MNRMKGEWWDYTWNIVTGCLNGCPYCDARRIAHGRLKSFYLGHRFPLAGDVSDPFAPRFWRYRLEEPMRVKKPAIIFVSLMGEFCGDCVPEVTQRLVFDVVAECPWHTFVFLTKYPWNLAKWNPWPQNAWVGVSAANFPMFVEAVKYLVSVKAPVKLVSIEPLLSWDGDVAFVSNLIAYGGINWLIIGSQTGPRVVIPELPWVFKILEAAQRTSTPVFVKNNIAKALNLGKVRQEWPEAAKRLS